MSQPSSKEDHRPPRLLIGTMSGTSADGVDAALTRITGRGLDMQAQYLGHVEQPYAADLRKRIFALRESGSVELKELASLGRQITLAYVQAVKALLAQQSIQPSQVAAIAAHGQTLYHEVPDTIQWLDPSLLAAETGIAVVSDFRRADLAAGGQGAPLVPFADWILFRHPEKTRVILNIGGIANLTYLPAGGGIDDVNAFDTGPGNCISDYLCRSQLGESFDAGGELAANGTSDTSLVVRFMQSDAYFEQPPPKSTDTAQMIAAWKKAIGGKEASKSMDIADLLATAAGVTADCLVAGLSAPNYPKRLQGRGGPWEVIVAGGGARNRAIMHQLRLGLQAQSEACKASPPPVLQLDETGFPTQAREAVAFAVMGAATLDSEPSNVPSATGAARRVVLGSVTPRQPA